MVLGPSQYGGGAGQTFCLLGQAVYLDQEDLPPPGKVVRLDQSQSLSLAAQSVCLRGKFCSDTAVQW